MTDPTTLSERIESHIRAEAARTHTTATPWEYWTALSRAIVEHIADPWEKTRHAYASGRQTHYFSAEFLVGRSLQNNLVNLGIYETVRDTVAAHGFDLGKLEELENDAALGNGGLGRLAACFMDSAATGGYPVTGYGILYRYGLFRQELENGFQHEYPDVWMERGFPWFIRRDSDRQCIRYSDMEVWAVPYDLPVVGYGIRNVNTIRLWKAEPAEEFDFNLFNSQRFDDAVVQRNRVNDIWRVLYPNDTSYDGKVLRVRQQYFFVSASLQDIVRRHMAAHGGDLSDFAELHSIQLNDTHPAIGIPELMRILTEEHGMSWEQAWDVTRKSFAYTNHTILSEALEQWDIGIFQFLFPGIADIVRRIDAQFRAEMASRGLMHDRIQKMAPIGDGKVRMAPLACYGSFSVNGVAALHTQILRNRVLRDWYQVYPDRFSNKTNGVSPRRWLRVSNPELSALLTELSGGEEWVTRLDALRDLEKFADDPEVLRRFLEIKKEKKRQLAEFIRREEAVDIDPESIFDIQAKRLHEYKRQLLNALQILHLYFRLRDDPGLDIPPQTFLFAAKAAPGYQRAKAIIKLINEIARVVNGDPAVAGRLRVVFSHNYNVSSAEKLFPAADISEQISTAGMEASGTGNMKFMLNGALTLGTLDGANVEIANIVGPENIQIFGVRVEDMDSTRSYYNPQWQYQNIPGLKRVLDALVDGTLQDGGTGMFQDLFNSLLYGSNWQPADPFFVLGDFKDYVIARDLLTGSYRDRMAWAKRCWINIVRGGIFSSDRTIGEYARDIWKIGPNRIG
ncbi:MAG: glycogen/starch/alpha-glucan phosphorylase [Clostridia bacterium]|nr:glycogen/starch/alpha-glucan phosphorylase [Clostridia bacterium]